MRKIHVVAGISAILAVVAWFTFSASWAIDALQAEARIRLGRGLSVTGGAHLELSPGLALRLDGVSLANADGLDGAFITAPSVRLPLSLGELLQHRLGDTMILVAPQISLEIGDKGQASWTGQAAAPKLLTFAIEDGGIRFFDHRNGQSLGVSDANLAVRLSPEGELTLNGNGAIGGRLAGLNAYVKSVGRIHSTGSPLDLSVDLPSLQASFNGRLATANSLSLAGPVSLSGPDLRDISQWAGTPIAGARGFKSFAVSGGLDSDGSDFTLRDSGVALDGLTAKGEIGLSLGKDTPQVLAQLRMPALDLDAYLATPDSNASEWSRAPLNYQALRTIDARVSLTADRLSYRGLNTGPAMVEATLAAGRLSATVSSGSVAGGSAKADVEFDGSSATPVFSAHVTGHDLDGVAGLGRLSGKTALNASLSGYGDSAAEVVSTLKGEAKIETVKGAIDGLSIADVIAAVSTAIVEGWPLAQGKSTSFDTLSASFTVADGIAATKDIAIAGESVKIAGKGEIDLLRRAVDLSTDPRIVTGSKGETSGLPVIVIVKGPWARPRIYPDMVDILLNPVQAYEALKALAPPGN